MCAIRQIAIDARWLRSGIGTYTCNLIKGLATQKNGFSLRAIVRTADISRLREFCEQIEVVDVPIYTIREHFGIPHAARGCDLLHVPHYNAPLLYRGKLIVSIHDLVHIQDPTRRWSPASWLYAFPLLHIVAHRAQHIITVSEYSRRQLVERLGVPPEKITVIYHGVEPAFQPLDPKQAFSTIERSIPNLHRPFVLYVGNLKPHKNLHALLAAFRLLVDSRRVTHQLVVVGDDCKWRPVLQEEARSLVERGRLVMVPQVSGDLLPALYSAAEAVVLPSTIEGFGLPVLEAMASGTPVVCSRAASLPEVAGDAAEYFDPQNVEEMADAIQRVLESTEQQDKLRQKGLQRARQFTWEECARKHCEVYRQVLGA